MRRSDLSCQNPKAKTGAKKRTNWKALKVL
jgi:hypothetical protein